jgi:hypothetical protein
MSIAHSGSAMESASDTGNWIDSKQRISRRHKSSERRQRRRTKVSGEPDVRRSFQVRLNDDLGIEGRAVEIQRSSQANNEQ